MTKTLTPLTPKTSDPKSKPQTPKQSPGAGARTPNPEPPQNSLAHPSPQTPKPGVLGISAPSPTGTEEADPPMQSLDSGKTSARSQGIKTSARSSASRGPRSERPALQEAGKPSTEKHSAAVEV
eukprot:CAMPEP_0184327982 /NCGR_PEP_ID=MMETSP1049-20130417/143379_1 /TAXON_ID=77928 /ORGANISM="Proteomonas sulcata, Strain CCMP704" /LENGTH=123 /DNA_ID=CAMNT_0026650265 /DNA_START=608 /DNA_END=979 /DNA_ORIENTATION=-